MRALLDINVLLALLDAGHLHHRQAGAWLDGEIRRGWASCADHSRIHGPRQVTDACLLGLAAHHGGRFVTFDRTVPSTAVRTAGPDHLVLL